MFPNSEAFPRGNIIESGTGAMTHGLQGKGTKAQSGRW